MQVGDICFKPWTGLMGWWATTIGSSVCRRSTSWTAYLHMGFDDSALLQAQANWKLARTCPKHFFLDEPIRWFSFVHWHLMNVKCKFNLLCLPAPWKGCLLWHAGLTHSFTHSLTHSLGLQTPFCFLLDLPNSFAICLMNWWLHSGRSTLLKQTFWQLKRDHERYWGHALVWKSGCWTSHRPINGWAVCCPRQGPANGRTMLTTSYKVRPVHSMFTMDSLWQNGFNGILSETFWCYCIGGLFCSWALQILKNLTRIAGNCSDMLWVRQLISIGMSRGIQYSMHRKDDTWELSRG